MGHHWNDICRCCRPWASHRWRIYRQCHLAMVFLYSLADWRNCRSSPLLLFRPSGFCGAPSDLLGKEAVIFRSSWYRSGNGGHYLLCPRPSVRRRHLSLEEQRGHRSPGRICTPRDCPSGMGALAGRLCQDAAETLEAALTFDHGPLPVLLHGKLHCSPVLSFPIYFQSILGPSPIKSGVNNLPLVLAAAVFALAGGAVVMTTGRVQQVMFVGSMLATIAIGLIYTLDIGTSTGKWAGYQFFTGASMAFAIMHGLTIAQANVGLEDLPAVTANLLCTCLSPFFSGHCSTKLTNMLYSLPDSWRCIQHFSRTVSLPQQTACHSAQDGPRSESRSGPSDRGLRAA